VTGIGGTRSHCRPLDWDLAAADVLRLVRRDRNPVRAALPLVRQDAGVATLSEFLGSARPFDMLEPDERARAGRALVPS